MAQNLTISVTVTDQSGASGTGTTTVTLTNAPVVNAIAVTPQSAPTGTSRHIVVSATGDSALTYTLNVPGQSAVTNGTGIFDVVI